MIVRRRSLGATAARQRGAAIVFIAVGLAAILVMAGLALDVGHTMLNKSRLQNATDAAALAAAKIFDNTKSTSLGGVEAATAFQLNASTTGDSELATAYANGSGSINLKVEWSATLSPFTPGSATGPYVRVTAAGFIRPTFLLGAAGIANTTVGATAVAGPSPSINQACNLVPMMVCANTNAATGGGAANNWGYAVNAPVVMKLAAPGGGTVGPGNFQLVNLGSPGANVVRQELAGGYGGCNSLSNPSNDTLTTQPGDETGPVADGLDTRFGIYNGNLNSSQAQYPPDVITTQSSPALYADTTTADCSNATPAQQTPCVTQGADSIAKGGTVITPNNISTIFSYQNYSAELSTPGDYTNDPKTGNPPGAPNRRVVAVPIANCSGGGGGAQSLPILAFGCFFLLQAPTHVGNTDWVLGQFISTCDVNGTPGPAPASGPQPYIIQLYRDPGSGDS